MNIFKRKPITAHIQIKSNTRIDFIGRIVSEKQYGNTARICFDTQANILSIEIIDGPQTSRVNIRMDDMRSLINLFDVQKIEYYKL